MPKNRLPTISIRGRDYILVKDRVLAFNELYPRGSIITEKFTEGDIIVFKATVTPDVQETPLRVFTGHSEAIRGVSQGITGQSPVEVAETSAVGRALAMMGIGIVDSIASADEIRKVSGFGAHADTMSAGKITPKQKDFIMELCISKGVKTTEEEIEQMNSWEASQKINKLKSMPDKVKTNATVKAEADFIQDLPDDDIPVINE